jgi:hypothetical protein
MYGEANNSHGAAQVANTLSGFHRKHRFLTVLARAATGLYGGMMTNTIHHKEKEVQ